MVHRKLWYVYTIYFTKTFIYQKVWGFSPCRDFEHNRKLDLCLRSMFIIIRLTIQTKNNEFERE